jgi:hypothetical protein
MRFTGRAAVRAAAPHRTGRQPLQPGGTPGDTADRDPLDRRAPPVLQRSEDRVAGEARVARRPSLFPAGCWYASATRVSRSARLRSTSPRTRSGTAESSFTTSGQPMAEPPRA